MRLGTEWTICRGRPASGNRLHEARNRNHNVFRRAQILRVYFDAYPGPFDPDDTNLAVQGVPYEEIVESVVEHGAQLLVMVGLHWLGNDPAGSQYHKRPPMVDVGRVRSYTRALKAYLADEDAAVWGWQLGNEFDYLPVLDGDTHAEWYQRWEQCFLAFRDEIGAGARYVSPGTSALEAGGQTGQGKPSINRWIAESGRYPSMILDIHGNNRTIDALRNEVQLARGLPGPNPVGVFEDRPPWGTGHIDALNRSLAVEGAGGMAFFPFGGRGAPACVGGFFRPEAGVETCDNFAINYDSFDSLTAASVRYGQLRPGNDLPMEIQQEVHVSKQLAARAARKIAASVKNSPAVVEQEILAGTRAVPIKKKLLRARTLLNQAIDAL